MRKAYRREVQEKRNVFSLLKMIEFIALTIVLVKNKNERFGTETWQRGWTGPQ